MDGLSLALRVVPNLRRRRSASGYESDLDEARSHFRPKIGYRHR